MAKKLSNREWQKYIDQYNSSDKEMSITKFCKENNLSKQQFHYHKKKLKDAENIGSVAFHKVKLNNDTTTSKISSMPVNEIKITIGKAIVSIPTSETKLISSIIMELMTNVKS